MSPINTDASKKTEEGIPDERMFGPWITNLEVEIVTEALQNGWYGSRAYHYVETFEREFGRYHQRKYALMTPNCTSAIHLLLAALDVGAGDEVIVPECTWIATAAPVTYVGAEPIFCDVDMEHWCVTRETIEAAITDRTKAVIAVDLYGNMPEMDEVRDLCERRNIVLIEDSAEALGSTYKGIKAGKFGIGSVFSFHRTKTITTGEGGMLLVDDMALYERCRLLRDHGRAPGMYYNTEVAYKYMPSNLQAALGYAQFQRLDELVNFKRKLLRAYKERLADIPDLFLNNERESVHNGAWCITLIFGRSHGMTKDRAKEELSKMGLPCRLFFYPLSCLPAFPGRESEGRRRNPVAYDLSERGINLPSSYRVTEEDVEVMCKGIHSILGC